MFFSSVLKAFFGKGILRKIVARVSGEERLLTFQAAGLQTGLT